MTTLSLDFEQDWLAQNDPVWHSQHNGQWRLARVEMVNWGTFDGYQALPVDRRGLLITGPSGSGKSTLLDGHHRADPQGAGLEADGRRLGRCQAMAQWC
jgi:hypothetical protein